ncbi:3-hydroxybutyryl-CoA dehydrogenase [Nonlabens tegetincola]|uniref:3-hydroxyacyl-CoA dehydrogenase NAD-binding domain-containing protein n=1 Tax=Nonlabens tegetincola TaxID=323273 RepID=UPI000A20497C|nr:3-hydroxyacyl-CoA dehydrogenase NAD-binding domain-containing protein [Nonlabens tegetincola]ARN71657.1 3-hydroxybutyryl-CoA dehydrogenase [Nonlabens tegetincola]
MKIKTVGIIGAGTMGRGIAQVAATAGCTVALFDTNQEALDNARASHEKIMNRLVEKGRIDEDEKNRILSNITYVDAVSAFAKADLIIEAIIENIDIKKKVFQTIEKTVSESCIVASNTSSLSIASIAASLDKPDRCVGIHFFNPAPLMKLVEVIPAVQTSEITLNTSVATIKEWGKVVAVAKDTPGFIVNRVARPFYGEAIRIFEEGIADIPTIDYALKGLGFKMGPFELTDFIGHDVNYVVTETVFKAFYYDPRYKPNFSQKRLVEAGWLGRKSGRGFYDYKNDEATNFYGKQEPNKETKLIEKIQDRILVMLINEAADALFLNIANATDIDTAMTKGVNYPKGLLSWANEKGISWCVDQLDSLYDLYREDRYRCSPLLRRLNEHGKQFDI